MITITKDYGLHGRSNNGTEVVYYGYTEPDSLSLRFRKNGILRYIPVDSEKDDNRPAFSVRFDNHIFYTVKQHAFITFNFRIEKYGSQPDVYIVYLTRIKLTVNGETPLNLAEEATITFVYTNRSTLTPSQTITTVLPAYTDTYIYDSPTGIVYDVPQWEESGGGWGYAIHNFYFTVTAFGETWTSDVLYGGGHGDYKHVLLTGSQSITCTMKV